MTEATPTIPSEDVPPAKQQRRRRIARWIIFFTLLFVALWFSRPAFNRFALSRARANLEQRNHDAALVWLNRAMMLNDNHAETHFLLARTYRRLEDFAKVNHHLKKAHDLGWDLKQLEREQNIALAQTGQFSAMARHFPELFMNAGSDGPEISQAYVLMLMSQFRLQPAMEVLDAWQRDFPEDPQPYVLRGRALSVIRNWKEAEDQYKRALELSSTHWEARRELAKCLMEQLRFKEAEEHLRKCLNHDASDVKAAVAYATCLRKRNQLEQARSLLKKHWDHLQDDLDALREMGQIELAAERPKQAVKYLRLAVKQNPVDRETRYILAQALRAAGETQAAQKELAFVNQATKPVLRLGQLVPKLVDDPENIDLRFEIAKITWTYKSRPEGVRWFQSLLQFAPDHSPTHLALARHYELEGDTEKAAFHRRKAGTANSTTP
ncbi:MAG: hypothetical protein Tsb009_05350 [Planctomycetaceae bacterium]